MTKRTKCILGIILVALAIALLICVWYYTRNAQYWYNKGMALYSSGMSEDPINPDKLIQAYKKFDRALKAFDKALKINPKYKEAWLEKGKVLYLSEKYHESLLAYEECLKIDPQYIKALYQKSKVLHRLGRFEEELNIYDEAIKIDPKYVSIWNYKGLTLCELGRYEESIKAFDESLKLNQTNELVWYSRARVYSLMRDKKNALSDLTKVISLDAEYKEEIKKDEDFKWLLEDEEFKKITQ